LNITPFYTTNHRINSKTLTDINKILLGIL